MDPNIGTKVEKVTAMAKEFENGSSAIGGISDGQVVEQTQARIRESEGIKNENGKSVKSKDDIGHSLPSHTNDNFIQSFNNIVRALISPQDEEIKRRWFEDGGESKLKFLSMAYKSNDDPSIINADVNKLPKIPQRLSVILNYKSEQEEGGGLEGLCENSASIAAWSISSGIPNVSIYEVTGVLKKSIPELSKSVFEKFESYFGTDNIPNFLIKIPHLNLSYSGIDGVLIDNGIERASKDDYDIEISLLSKVDGRSTIVEMTKVMAQLAKNGELKKSDITIKFLDHELRQLVGEEPDLIILFQPYLDLQGYPPWHIRLTEMYWEPDNDSVSYVVFLRALQKYSTCKVNIGR